MTPSPATHFPPSTVLAWHHHVSKGTAPVAAQAFRAAVARSAGARWGHIGEDPSQALTEPHVAEWCRIPPLHSWFEDP